MKEKFEKLKKYFVEVNDIHKSIGLLAWDQETFMPKGGGNSRASQISTLTRISHDMFIADEVGAYLADLKDYAEELPYESDDASFFRFLSREYKKKRLVPSDHAAEMANVASTSQGIWAQARQDNNFKAFKPALDSLLELTRTYTSFFSPYDEMYDVLLDDYEPGLKTCDVRTLFNKLEDEQVELLEQINSKPTLDDSILRGDFSDKSQLNFATLLATKIGYDWSCGRLDKSEHPFSQAMDIGDARITTRLDPNFLGSNLSSVLHEAGHAMYEQGISKSIAGNILAEGTSYAMHESQSRFWENIIGRSKPFVKYILPLFKEAFPDKAAIANEQLLFDAFNRVEPSLIRVEADEVSYNLHIMLRMDLEIELLEGRLDTNDLPDAWNHGMKKRLGLEPTSDRDGVLQDVHWSIGAFGYFPTYAIGNLISAQLWEALQNDLDVSSLIVHGEFAPILSWMRKNIHQYGSKFEPNELILKATGKELSYKPYIKYLKNKLL